jgi:hypothetical protein
VGHLKGEAAPCHKGMGPKLNSDIKTSKNESCCSNTYNELLFTEKNTCKLDRECTNLKEKNGHRGMFGSVPHGEADENGNHGGNPSNNSS